mgnify:CR=1 FL=1
MSEIDTKNETVNELQDIQKSFLDLNKNHSKIMSDITEVIKISDWDLEDIKKDLIKFAAVQQQVMNKKTISDRVLEQVSVIPGLKKFSANTIEQNREKRLSEETVSGLVRKMYEGLKKQCQDVEDSESNMVKIRQEVLKNIDIMEALSSRLKVIIENNDIPDEYQVSVLKVKNQIQLLIEKSKNKVDALNMIIPISRSSLELFYQYMPINEADLLTDISMSRNVTKLNKLSMELNEMKELTDIVSNSVWENMLTNITNFAKFEVNMSDKEIKRIEDNMNSRNKLMKTAMIAVNEQKERAIEITKAVEVISDQSNKHRQEIKSLAKLG